MVLHAKLLAYFKIVDFDVCAQLTDDQVSALSMHTLYKTDAIA